MSRPILYCDDSLFSAKMLCICRTEHMLFSCPVITSAKEVMFLPVFVCLSVCLFVCLSACYQDNSKSYGRIFVKF